MAGIIIRNEAGGELPARKQLRLATIEPRAARVTIINVWLDIDYFRHLDDLRKVLKKLHKPKAQQP